MGKIIDEYMDIKLQHEYISKTIDALWKMAKKYQKIEQIIKDHDVDKMPENYWYIDKIREVVEDDRN